MTTSDALDPQEREVLAQIADQLIPRSDEMPSASDVGIHRDLIDRVLRSRPDAVQALRDLLARAADADPEQFVRDLPVTDPDGSYLLRLFVGGGYLMDRRVADLIGYHGQVARPVNPNDYLGYVEEGLLDPVLERGPIYREA
ncbi:gluconate 2-dehydrogenase subunit 3 family protein [Nocardioides sp.]|uniref:gluconate 2-dehydrogenase subunit 3 family protein n=1 Tax=Nocardioides sp. TaxID=35761 RepID=UPI003782D4E1